MKDILYRMRLRMSQFLYGRNGQDDISNACYLTGLVLFILSLITKQTVIYSIALIIWGYSIFRIFSKNIIRRQAENVWYLRKKEEVTKWWRFQGKRRSDRKISKYYRCKECKQMIRVPRGRGKIEITCPRCQNRFIKRT